MTLKHMTCYRLMLPALILTAGGCGVLNTDLGIPEKPLPESFPKQQHAATTTSAADVNWRDYFDDAQLVKLIDGAVGNNLDLQVALQRIESARASVKLANGKLLPKVDLNIGGGVRKFGLYTMDGAGNASTFITPGEIVPENLPDIYVGMQASWEVDIWGKLRNQRKAAVAQYLSTIEGANFVISNLVADVAINYNELLALDNELEVIGQTIEKQQEALDVIKIQKDAGRANELAVQQFNAQLLESKVLETATRQQIIETENRINFLLGRFPQPIEREKTALFKPTPKKIMTGLPSQLLANRPDVRAAEYQIEASKFDLKAAKAAFLPNFNISAALGFQAFNPEFLFTSPASLAYSLMGTLIAPLVNMNALKAQFNSAQANQLTAMYNYQNTILKAYVEVANQLAGIRNLQQINALKKQQSDILKEAVQTSKELYKYAKANYFEVLMAQHNALQANVELIATAKQQRIATINIYKALGGGWK